MEQGYNGWKNRQTWNVALWIGNDYGLYMAAVEYVNKRLEKSKVTKGLYNGFIKHMGLEETRTPDNIAWDGSRLDHAALNRMMRDLVS